MTIIDPKTSKRLIPQSMFDPIIINGKKHTLSDIKEEYPRRVDGAYLLDKVNNFLKEEYSIDIKEYTIKYLGFDWPKCPNVGEDVSYRILGRGILLMDFIKATAEFSEAMAKHKDKLSKERRGKNNPMYGATPWNKGESAETNDKVKAISEKRIGWVTPDETRKKQSKAAKKRKIHGHTGHKHSPETKALFREIIAKRWETGVFSRRTGIEIKVSKFLDSLPLKSKYVEQHCVKYFTLDFAFPEHKLGIECDGTFYHVDPRAYPDGPITSIQRKNLGRDKSKHHYLCERNDWDVIHLWEIDINDNTYKENLLCKLREYDLLEN